MPDVDDHAPGTPSWVDLSSPDVEASASFYGGLFGWEAFEPGPAEETGGYRIFTLHGRNVAGVAPQQAEGQPTAWTTYIAVPDAGAAAEAVAGAGGQVLLEPLQVMDQGTMALFADPVGAVVAVWQPDRHRGAQVVNDAGSLSWNELACRDPQAAGGFYEAVFGWEGETAPIAGTNYTVFSVGGRQVAGMLEMDEQWPAEVPAHWMAYFAVDDTDEVARRAKELGGAVLVPPTDIAPGRFAVLQDPHGAAFSVIRPAEVPG